MQSMMAMRDRCEVTPEEAAAMLRQAELRNKELNTMTAAELDAYDRAKRIAAERNGARPPSRPGEPVAELSNLTADGGLGVITLGGKDYLASQPALVELGTLGAFLRRRIKTPVEELQADAGFQALPAEEQKPLLAQTAREYLKDRQTWISANMLEALTSLEGTQFAVWICLRKQQPAITLDKVRELVTEANCHEVLVELSSAVGMSQLGNLAGTPG